MAKNMLDNVFYFFSFIGGFAAIWIVGAVILIATEEVRHKKFFPVFALSVATSYVLSFFLKIMFSIPRPSLIYPTVSMCPTDFSFPSGHAATSFAAATVLSYFDKKRWWIYYVVAVLVSYSRIYLGCHYATDVAGGAILGFIIAKLYVGLFSLKTRLS